MNEEKVQSLMNIIKQIVIVIVLNTILSIGFHFYTQFLILLLPLLIYQLWLLYKLIKFYKILKQEAR